MILRHWTAAARVALIVRQGVILPTESNVHPTGHCGPDVVWLLPPDVEPGAGGDHGLMPEKRTGWIDVDVPGIRWEQWEWTGRMDASWRRAFVEAGGGHEMAAQWYVWPAPIPARRFVNWSEEAGDVSLWG